MIFNRQKKVRLWDATTFSDVSPDNNDYDVVAFGNTLSGEIKRADKSEQRVAIPQQKEQTSPFIDNKHERFCFEEDISSVIQVAAPYRITALVQQRDEDGNDKRPKTFALKQRIMIAFQPLSARFFNNATYNFTLKDIIIVVLLLLLLFVLISSSSLGNNYSNGFIVNDVKLRRRVNDGGNKIITHSEVLVKIVPKHYESAFVDVTDTIVRKTDTPLFFHVPRSAGITLQDVLSHCWNLVEASQVGTTHGHDKELTLKVWQHEDGGRYVNVDTTTFDGIERANQLKLPQSGLADVVYTTYLYQMSCLFSNNYQARVFTLFRHPISRAVSMYYYLQDAVVREEVSALLSYATIDDYAKSPHMENNLITRLIVNQMEGPLKAENLVQAKEILRQKFLIGLTSKFGQSLERFKYYFGWQKSLLLEETPGGELSRTQLCEDNLVNSGDNKHDHPNVEQGSHSWNLLAAQNIYDLQLYEYAETLFEEQGFQLFEVSTTIEQ